MENSKIINKIVAMQPELMSFAFKLTANQDSANDLVQDSILKALDNTQKFIRQENFKGWMYTIMRNLFINNYRRSVRDLNFLDSRKNGLAHRNNQKPFSLCPKETSKGFERFLVRNSRTKDSHLIIIDF